MHSRIIFTLLLLCAFPALAENAAPSPPSKFYKYAHNDAEYTIMLPEAPSVKTIWTDDSAEKTPYLEAPPDDGVIGETATFKRVDMATDDYFDVKITFLKADQHFLADLTPKKMQAAIDNDFKDTHLDGKKFDFSANPDNDMKWAIATGFSVDQNGRLFYNAEHYLTGQQSILTVKVQYSVENPVFADYYKKLTDNITYRPL